MEKLLIELMEKIDIRNQLNEEILLMIEECRKLEHKKSKYDICKK